MLSVEIGMPMTELIICLAVSGSEGQYPSAQRIS